MDREEVIKWLKIMKANLNSFPEINCGNKIEALAEAIRLLKNEQSEKPTGSITKNDLPHCQYTDAEIAKSFIEDVEAVKDQLPCGEQMDFPNTFDEFAKDYGFKDKDEIYTNGIELIPVYRVKQWLEHISTTKNDLGVDCIDRKATLDAIIKRLGIKNEAYLLEAERVIYQQILAMPPVTPIRPKGHWIYDKSFANWRCSKCGETPKTIAYVGTGAFMAEHFKYCNHCGAKMEGSEEV